MNKTLLAGGLLLVLCLASIGASAQNIADDLLRADKQYDLYAYNLALRSYEQVLRQDGRNAHALARIADCYFQLNKPQESLEWYEKAAQLYDAKPEVLKRYGMALMQTGDYVMARKWFRLYEESDPAVGEHYANMCDYAITAGKKDPAYVAKNEPVNTEAADYGPAFLANRIVYSSARTDITRKTQGKTAKDFSGSAYNQLFVTQRNVENMYLQKPSFLRTDLQNNYNEGPVTFSGDGNRVVFCRNNFIDGTRQIADKGLSLSLYYADVEDNGNWVNIRPFIHNGDYAMGFPSLSYDGNMLVFASNKPEGSYGGWDIYVSNWTKNGWSTPRNLGAPLNTPGNEVTPYFDGKNLYFSSDWHRGLGGLDVFRAELGEETVTDIFHLGPGINSPRDDYGFIYDYSKNIGYLTSNRAGGRGNEDIWQITKKESAIARNEESATKDRVERPVEQSIKKANHGEGDLFLLVTDEKNEPVYDAVVDFSDCGVGVGRTNDDGKYFFNEFFRAFDCKVEVRKDGFEDETIELSDFGKQSLMVSLTPAQREEYFGRVVDSKNREGLANVTVSVPTKSGRTGQTTTDFDGSYSLRLEPGNTYTVSYSKDGYVTDLVPTKASKGNSRNLAPVALDRYNDDSLEPDTRSSRKKDDVVDVTPKSKKTESEIDGYAIQLASNPEPLPDSKLRKYESLTKHGNLYMKEERNGVKVRLGIYSSKAEAQEVLDIVHKNPNSRDAFVVEERDADEGLLVESTNVRDNSKKPDTRSTRKSDIVYAVQLDSYEKEKSVRMKSYAKAADAGNLYSKVENNTTKVRVGVWRTHKEAENAQDDLLDMGFKEAIIVTEKADDESIQDFLISNDPEPKADQKSIRPVENKSRKLTEHGSGNKAKNASPYMVRLTTLSNPDGFDYDNASEFGGEIETRKASNGMTIFLLGGFADRASAEDALAAAHKNGFTESFLVKDEKGALKRVE